MGGACDTYKESRDAYSVLEGQPEENNALGIPKRSW
jgi:hypothetical protein